MRCQKAEIFLDEAIVLLPILPSDVHQSGALALESIGKGYGLDCKGLKFERVSFEN